MNFSALIKAHSHSSEQTTHQWAQWMNGGCLWPAQILASKLLCRQKGCGQSVEVTVNKVAFCMYCRYWKTLPCRKWSGTRAAWSLACVSWSPGWSLSWYGELRGLSALVWCLFPCPTLLTLQWESSLVKCVNRPLWLAITFVWALLVNVEESWVDD